MSRTTASADPVASVDPPEFVIGFPADFRDLPLASEPATWGAIATAFLDLVPVERPPEYRELALAHLRAYSALLATGGVVKAAACLGSSAGTLSTASVLVSWLPASPAAPADIAAMGLFAALSERHDDREVYAIELPVGPAVAVVAECWLGGKAPDGTTVQLPVRSIEVSIPVDNQPWLLVVALSSPTPADWESYQAIMAVICRSVRFLHPADPVN
ncbi:MAG: hypothetical protein JO115_04320 [Pseudonocardiales bacterium]|nr:hypothetical protein [Pseudonocardiales bacterium]